jgi:hypothetical protein
MNAIQTFIVRAKHWQIFVLVVALMGAAEIVARPWKLPGEGGSRLAFLPLFISTELAAVGFWLWFWSLGIFLNSAVIPELRGGTKMLRVAAAFPAVYFPLFDLVAYSLKPTLFLLVFPAHVFATFCLFYALYFVSKNLVLAEKATPVEFPTYLGTLFLIWFLPIGVWFTQPRINRLWAKTALPLSS